MRRDWRNGLLNGYALFVGLLLLAPTLIVVPMSLTSGERLQFPPPGFSTRWYGEFFSDEAWITALTTSVKVAVVTVIVATILGTLIAFGLERGRFRGRALVRGFVLVPAIVPVVVVAIGMYFVFTRWHLTGTMTSVVIAHTVLALPLVVVTVSSSLRTLDRNLEDAAGTLGAGPIRTFRYVVLPAIMPGVMAAGLFAFITSWDEVVIALFLTGPSFRTLPTMMWIQIGSQIDPTIAVVATLQLGVTMLALVLVLLSRRRLSTPAK
jgi:putative spermidine/putrescine transport system permease protein